ncbi:MAG: hypothetical protein IT536_01485 [Hyphomicrobiales bacterium]|nr:hypothetical protein [Hyphomicrobiales bacterium]
MRISIALLLGVVGSIATAPQVSGFEFVAPGSWKSDSGVKSVTPGTWKTWVSRPGPEPVVTTAAEGDNHYGILELWCRPDMRAGGLVFYGHKDSALYTTGGPLRYVPENAKSEVTQQVIFRIDRSAFPVEFTYTPWERTWVANDLLSARFLEAFASGTSLAIVVQGKGVVTEFRLNGTRKAREMMSAVCKN